MVKKENGNKGFSLVELIVVVLIMAIIAVALAPQVIKWVNNSRIAADFKTKNLVMEAMQMAVLTDEVVNDMARDNGAKLVVDKDGMTLKKKADGTGDDYDSSEALHRKFCEYAGTSDFSSIKTKVSDSKIVIVVDEGAAIITAKYLDEDDNEVMDISDR